MPDGNHMIRIFIEHDAEVTRAMIYTEKALITAVITADSINITDAPPSSLITVAQQSFGSC